MCFVFFTFVKAANLALKKLFPPTFSQSKIYGRAFNPTMFNKFALRDL